MSAGTNIRGAERLAGLAYARQWRIDNKPYFYAIYGPEPAAPVRLRDLLANLIELDAALSAAYGEPGDTELAVDHIEDECWEAAQALRNHLIFNEGLDADMIRKLGEVLT